MTIRVSLVDRPDDFEKLEQVWNDLVDHMERPEIFYRWEWNWLSYRCFRSNSSLFIVVAEEAGKVVGIAPLCLARRRAFGIGVRVVEPIATRIADYCNFLVRAGVHRRRVVKAILNFFHEQRKEWDVIDLCELTSRDPTTFHIATIANEIPDLTCSIEIMSRTPYIDYKTYPAGIDSKQIRWIRARRKVLGDMGFTFHVGDVVTDEFWADLWRLRDLRWSGGQVDQNRTTFYNELRRVFEPMGFLECSAARYEGKTVAIHFGFRDARRVYYYMPVTDQTFNERRVGAVLGNEIVEYYSNSHDEMDLLRGDEPYKYWWTGDVAVNCRLRIAYGNNRAGLAYNLSPALKGAVRSLAAPKYLRNRIGMLRKRHP